MNGDEPQNTVNVVSKLTGLSPHVLRVWERRYGAVTPQRTASNRRLYTDEEVARLRLLSDATNAGYPIGRIAQLPTERLVELARRGRGVASSETPSPASPAPRPEDCLRACMEAATNFDAGGLEKALREAHRGLSLPLLLERVVIPLLGWIGDSWHRGELRIAHEHLASEVIRQFLGELRAATPVTPGTPVVVCTTPPGAQHEMGALLAAAAASAEGWRSVYLGRDLPVEETANAAVSVGAHVLAMSAIYAPDASALERDLRSLVRYLPEEVSFVLGGAGSASVASVAQELGGVYLPSLQDFREYLREAAAQR